MPIKPIDFQIMIPRTVDASKSQNDEFSKLLSVQQNANNSIQHESEKGLRKVQHRDKSYKTSVDKDGKGNQGYEQDEKSEGEQEDKQSKGMTKNKESMNKTHSLVHIDIKI